MSELAALLDRLRRETGLSGSELARRAGFSQSKVSRILGGKYLPSVPDAGRLAWTLFRAKPTAATAPMRRRVLELARDAHEDARSVVTTRVVLQPFAVANLQRRFARAEKQASEVATFSPLMVPGLLQTEGYMRAIYRSGGGVPSGPEEEEWLAIRRGRHDVSMSQDRPRKYRQLLAESTLAWGVAGADVMAEQCDHLASAIDRPGWRIGIIPRVPKDPTARPEFPQNAFDLHDEKSLVLGTSGGVAVTQDPHTVRRHVDLLRRLEALAVYGDEARAILIRTAESYRGQKAG
ncbi:Scr1 family TA system antitoxin-like transcriptional regulator [Pseudonocardia sp. RS010]|uniref:Scr1 family TA system antitoxin-like transcriptional regulator n=1 Tax=Pseudonocardia sp. RS010 TaxID=3385979 RepID=UPI0039A2A1DA